MNRIAAAILLAFSGAALAQTSTAPVAPSVPTSVSAVDAAAVLNAHLAVDVTRSMMLFDVPGFAIAVV
jgi:hypothetical protein